jgi:predicted RNase H-like nuclease (RuvC/YqgF family)
MNASNYPSPSGLNEPQKRNYKNLVIALMAATLVGMGIYMAVDKTKTTEKIVYQEAQITKVTDEKSEIQKNFDASLARLDAMTETNNGLEKKLTEKNKEIAGVKKQIRTILNNKNATAAELAKAKELIAQLNDKIVNMEQEVARLTQENQTLGQEKIVLTQEKEALTQNLAVTTSAKEELAKKVDIASTLNAYNIAITPLKVKSNGSEKLSTTAKRVDKMLISFDVDNRIAESGQTDLYVVIIGPDGKMITDQANGAATFTTREEGDKVFTTKLPVDFEAAKRKKVEFAWKDTNKFKTGNYTVQIYQNGFKIGEGTRELKKGGLFS